MCQADLKLKNFHLSVTAAVVVVGLGGALFFRTGEAAFAIYTSPTLSEE